MRSALFAIPLALAVVACSTAPDEEVGSTATVQITATYRERILLPPGHVLTVRVEDVSLADAPARVLAEVRQPLEGRGPPYEVDLVVPADRMDPRHTYAARAEIRDAAGALRFTTDTRHSVLTQGAPNRADIVMVGVPQG